MMEHPALNIWQEEGTGAYSHGADIPDQARSPQHVGVVFKPDPFPGATQQIPVKEGHQNRLDYGKEDEDPVEDQEGEGESEVRCPPTEDSGFRHRDHLQRPVKRHFAHQYQRAHWPRQSFEAGFARSGEQNW